MIKTIIVTNAKSAAAKLHNFTCIPEDLIQKTKSIMDDVAKNGDSAVIDYTEKLDGVRLNS
ncbi:MAG TPA: histidinol dehydrogenase, partial [Nitrososphaeraceae archaeon]